MWKLVENFHKICPHLVEMSFLSLVLILILFFHGGDITFRLAINMGIENLVCFSDSQLSVNLISGEVSKFHAHAVLIQDIKDLIVAHNYNILHTLREGNHCANFMAKLGASSNVAFLEHESPPHDLIDKLKIDAMGTCFLRA